MLKTILITGVSSGFGRNTAETLARAGHRVVASVRNAGRRNREVAEALCAQGIGVVQLGVTNSASVEAAPPRRAGAGRGAGAGGSHRRPRLQRRRFDMFTDTLLIDRALKGGAG